MWFIHAAVLQYLRQNSIDINIIHWWLNVQSQSGLSKHRIFSNKDQGIMAWIKFWPYISMAQIYKSWEIFKGKIEQKNQGIQRLPGLNIKCYSRVAQPLSYSLIQTYKPGLTWPNRRFNFDKFRVFKRLIVKSTVSHSRITWSESQIYKGSITRFVGEYTWRPSLLRGTTKLLFI